MAKAFPEEPYFTGNFAPILMECDAADLPIIGELPRELCGTLYRNGPNPQYAPRDDRYHWFVGDGMVHAFHIDNGRVSYRNRWVRTEKFQLERAAGCTLFGSWGNPITSDPAVIGRNGGVANTNIIRHNGRLFALEEAHLPVELDCALETKGSCDFGGKLRSRMTAHPKTDPLTGELIFFAYSAGGPFSRTIDYGVIDRDGNLTRLETFEAPYSSMVHDFLVTKNYVLFPILPLTGSMERAMKGEPAYAWEPDKGSHIAVLRRDDPRAPMRWFRTDACYVFHPMNAWEDGTRIIADVMQYERAPLFPSASGSKQDSADGAARLCRWMFDLAANTESFARDYVDDLPGEFPRFDERFATEAYRHGYYAWRRRADAASFDALAHFDRITGTRALHALPEGDAISEPVFVPRAEGSAEGDGFLLAVAYRGAEKRSDLVIFEAQALTDGPIASVQLSHRVPFGFHGNWSPQLPG